MLNLESSSPLRFYWVKHDKSLNHANINEKENTRKQNIEKKHTNEKTNNETYDTKIETHKETAATLLYTTKQPFPSPFSKLRKHLPPTPRPLFLLAVILAKLQEFENIGMPRLQINCKCSLTLSSTSKQFTCRSVKKGWKLTCRNKNTVSRYRWFRHLWGKIEANCGSESRPQAHP